jgi:hypothetical protein
MASFTDQISKFNPYVAQLPSDAMVKVGMYKQAQYDAGVQKIQSYMDNIAGMDIYNEGDKAYVQSKLDSLGNDLKIVAAGDFSNQQLVNSVGGMATQIVKDANVQNAIATTAQFRKTLARIEKDQADGKAGANNIEDFYAQAKPWMESTEAGVKLKASYSQYRDVNKSALEIIKGMHSSLRSIDIPFEVKNGKINTKAIADAMKRNKIEGITEGAIITALRAGLSSEDYNQLAIDGRSTFRDVPEEKLNSIVSDTLGKTKEQNGLDIKKLQTELPSQVQDPNKTDELNKRIQWYKGQGYIMKDEKGNVTENVNGELDKQAEEDFSLIQSNPNKVKESLYRQGFFQQFANGFKWNNEDFSYVTNPLKQQENWVADMNLKWAAENRQKLKDDRDYELAVRKDARETAKEKREAEEFNGAPGIPVEEGNPTDNALKSPERLQGHMTEVANGILGMKQSLMGKGYTDAQVNGMIADYEKNGNKANIPATEIGTIQDILRQKQYFNDLDKLNKTAKAEAQNEITGDAAVGKQIAEREAFVQKTFDPNKRVVTAKAYDGSPGLNISEKEFIDGVRSGKIGYSYDKGPLGQVYVTVNGKQYNFNKIGAGGNPAFKELVEKAISYSNKYGKIDKDIETKIDQKYKEKLGPRVAELVPTVTGMGFGKDGTVPTRVANNLVAFIGAADAKEIAANEDFNTKTASGRLAGDNLKNTKVLLRQDGNKYQAIIRDLTDPGNDQVLNISQKNAIDIFGAENVNMNKQDALRIRAGRGSNNVNGGPKSAPMQVQFGDFPNIRSLQVTAQLDEDTKYQGQFVPKVHLLKKDGTYQTFEISGKNRAQRVGYDQGKQVLNNLTDDTMMKLLKELYPTYDFSQIYRK